MRDERPFPEAGRSHDPAEVPWDDAVVWWDRDREGRRVYEWLTVQHVKSVSWASGVVAVQVAGSSRLGGRLSYVVLQAPFVAVGRNVPA